MMGKRIGRICLAAILTLLLSGCVAGSVSELYTLPKLPEDYQKLQVKIEQVLAENSAETAAPLTGELTQAVQLQDLDADGVKEAIAFFRVSSDKLPLKIYIYRQVGDDYEVATVIEGPGSAINSVAYENLDDSPAREIVVSWQMSEKVCSLAAYSIVQNQAVELLQTDYTDFRLFDLDEDGQKELVVLQTDGAGEGSRLELYNFHGVLDLESTAPLSRSAGAYITGGMQTGYLRAGVPAVFVPSGYGENERVTDIFAWQGERLRNVTLDAKTGDSVSTICRNNQISCTDINGDGIMELPDPYALPEPNQTTAAVNFWAIRWLQFDENGRSVVAFTAYHNERDGWYFILPEEWEGKICLSRNDQVGGSERAVVFSYWEQDSDRAPEAFLIIYRLTGDNRERRADLAGRFRLWPMQGRGSDVIYAARLVESAWDSGLTAESVRASFALIFSSGSME